MIIYALTILVSAFLLFLVQPIMAKQVLSWFGGSAAVWTTCLVFFQFLLLFGYAYSDWTTRRLKPRHQVMLHIALLAISLASLPIIPDASWKPAGDEDPGWRILGLLGATIALPYFLLSTTGPLVQAWFARTFPEGTVYRLFALSNFGSLLALVSYPFLIEPWVTTRQQSYVWSAGYVLFAISCAAAAIFSNRSGVSLASARPAVAEEPSAAPKAHDYALWLVLSGMGSFMLLAVTNHITHDVASVPFLWILPLTLYLLTFILCFEGRGWYQRRYFLGPLIIVTGAMAWGLHADRGIMDIKEAVPLFTAGMFVSCMFFHGELANLKPSPRYLTRFYLMVSLGGALGGVLIGLVAPRIFATYYEFGIGLVFTLLLAGYVTRHMPRWVPALTLAGAAFTLYHIVTYVEGLSENARVLTRNFYGTLKVRDTGPATDREAMRRLTHGVIMHGEQYLAPDRQRTATTYYGVTSGIGRLLTLLGDRPVKVGVVGLGAGTLAAYGKAGDVYRFYEINPQVIRIARTEFTYLPGSPAKIETVLGDARLALEREAPQGYDVLAIDAFSSDSIPVHLITREALAVYLRQVKPDGVIAFHVTNRFLKLAPVVQQLAAEQGLQTALVTDDADNSDLARTDWVLVTRDGGRLMQRRIAEATIAIDPLPGMRAWTDDFNNLFQILK
jgi:SAM-dependent methyltransferase